MGENEVGSVEDDIAQLEGAVAQLKARFARPPMIDLVVEGQSPTYASYASAMVEARKRLQRFLPGSYFSDPAFDMVLDLFAATEAREKRSFKAAALASRVPAATAARYVEMMVRDGIILREPDPSDGRRTLLSLSESAMVALREWLGSISSIPLRRG